VVVAAGVEYEDEKQSDIVASGVSCLSLVWGILGGMFEADCSLLSFMIPVPDNSLVRWGYGEQNMDLAHLYYLQTSSGSSRG